MPIFFDCVNGFASASKSIFAGSTIAHPSAPLQMSNPVGGNRLIQQVTHLRHDLLAVAATKYERNGVNGKLYMEKPILFTKGGRWRRGKAAEQHARGRVPRLPDGRAKELG
jgi:hypothetical protein